MLTAETLNKSGMAYNEKGDYDRAIADLTQAIRLDPNNVYAYYMRGSAYHEKKDYDRAIADFTQAIRLENCTGYYRRRGIAYMEKGDFTQARRDFETAVQLDPANQNAKDNLAELQRRGG
jgi:tetratricopeptide (TPR) repeat protein